MLEIPNIMCMHKNTAYKDVEIGSLDEDHIFCDCDSVVCLVIKSVRGKSGYCKKCCIWLIETISGQVVKVPKMINKK